MFPVTVCSSDITSTQITRRRTTRNVPGDNSHQPTEPCISSLMGICLCGRPSPLGRVSTHRQDWVIDANSTATFDSICDDADYQLFERITSNSQHLLHPLLPPEREQHYSLRERSHNYQLPERTTQLKDKNFIIRMLYKDWLLNFPHHTPILW